MAVTFFAVGGQTNEFVQFNFDSIRLQMSWVTFELQ